MQDVMIDLETMGTMSRAAIVAIGAVEFDPKANAIGARFYRVVDLASSMKAGLEVDGDTVLWWMRQGDNARLEFSAGAVPLREALDDFTAWMKGRGQYDDLQVWGNGASFDNPLLADAYRAVGLPQPWPFWGDRCYRTIKAMRPDVRIQRVGVHHKAVDDAESQALHLMEILRVGL